MGLLDLFRKSKNEIKSSQDPIADLFNDLTIEQRYSIMQLYSFCNVTFFENFQNSKKSYEIITAASNNLGVSIQQADKYFETHGQFTNLITQMCSISDKSILDIILVDYMHMIALSDGKKRVQRSELISMVYGELGYSEDDIINVMEKFSAITKTMFNL